jgi:plastocyanin
LITRYARIAIAGLAIAAFAVAAVACGGDDNNDDNGSAATQPAGGSATQPTGGSTQPAGGGSVAQTVVAKDFEFNPGDFDVTAGQKLTVTLRNDGSVTHTMTLYEDEAFTKPVTGGDTGQVTAGSTGNFTVTLTKTQDYYFRCEIHPTQMKGEIGVK